MKVHGYPTGALGVVLGLIVCVVVAFGAVGGAIAWFWKRRWLVGLAIGVVVGVVVIACLAMAQTGAHGDGHAQMHDIYKNWSPPNNPKTSCCSAVKPDGTGDCRPTRAFVDDEGNWQAWNGKRYLVVPPERVLPPDFAGDGRSHLCEKGDYIYCFTPGPIRG